MLALYAIGGLVRGEHADSTPFDFRPGVTEFVLAAKSEVLDSAFPEIVDDGIAGIIVHPVQMRGPVSAFAMHLAILNHFRLESKETALGKFGGGKFTPSGWESIKSAVMLVMNFHFITTHIVDRFDGHQNFAL
jgi:hypothetical protein